MLMSNEFLKFCTPDINQAAIDEVIACLKSGWLTTGPRVKCFENKLKQYLKARSVITLNSATSGLHLTLKCLDLKEQDEVITTPMTFIASINTIIHAGAKPVLVDVDFKTRNIDITKIESKITENTKAILPVHFAGIPVDLDSLYSIASKHNLRVIEDCAHAIGSHYKGRILGSFGDTQVFSFHPNKVMTTGEGGCVSTKDKELVKKINVQKFHGIDRESWNRYGKEGTQHYDVVQPGYKYNMMDLQAAIGIHQLQELENFISKRQKLVDRYHEILANWPELTLPKLPEYPCRVSWYIYAPLINPEKTGMTRDIFIERMKEYNIGTGYHHHAAHLYTYYQNTFGYKLGHFPNAEDISNRIVSLPLFAAMTIVDQDRVILAMKRIFNKR
jgi:dTDP-4-amino-4,6-dideoxygalactose transaminase